MTSASRLYQRTQIAWAIIVPVALVVPATAAVLALAELPVVAAGASLFLLGIGLLFGTLTVGVDSHRLRCRFGIGLFSKSVDLSEVRFVRRVRNSWVLGGLGAHLRRARGLSTAICDGL